ncbi:MAG TPA: MlaD family protein [Thermoanaerobaculia bacterium]|nr:MlaD family protein [Thermoanaerobaculia bacterium]
MPQVLKLGLFGTLCLVILAVLIWKIEDINPFQHQGGKRLDAVFNSVAGLDDKASVRVAGVRVGRVDGIGLSGRKARVSMLLDKPLPLTQGTTAKIANLGLLGEKYVELVPGPEGAPLLPDHAVLQGQTPVSFDDAMAKLEAIGDSIQGVTSQLGGGPGGGGFKPLLDSLEATSGEIRALVAENRANVASTVRNMDAFSATLARELPRLAGEMSKTVQQISDLVAANRGDVNASLGNIRQLTGNLQTSVDNLNQITGKIASGEGTVGKLVNKNEAYDKVVSTLDSIKGGVDTLSGTLGAMNRFKLNLDLQAYQLPSLHDSQSTFQIDIDPSDGKHLYRAGIEQTPAGKQRLKTQRFTITGPEGITTTTTVQTLTTENTYVGTGLFGFHTPDDLRLWAGIIENTGGAAIEYPWASKKLRFSIEAFDFNRQDNKKAHLRFTTRWQFHPNLYLVGGYDDPLENHSLFLGGGIRWTDDNLKYLLGAATKFGG